MRLGPVHAGCIMPTHLDIDDLIARMIKLQLPKATLLLMRLCVYIELGVDWVKRNLYILYPNSAQLIQCIDKHVFKLCYCIYIYIYLYIHFTHVSIPCQRQSEIVRRQHANKLYYIPFATSQTKRCISPACQTSRFLWVFASRGINWVLIISCPRKIVI